MEKHLSAVCLLLCTHVSIWAQNYAEILKSDSTKITLGGYVDTYYGFDFSQPDGKVKPYFVSSNRHNEFTVNLAMVDFKYLSSSARAVFRPAFGTFMQYNYASEPPMFQHLYEANAGMKLFKKKDIWLDAGIFYSPYTNESGISKDHLMYTRSLAPEYVPYYLSGARLTLPLSSKMTSTLYVLNGWQTIQNTSNKKSIGTQLEYKANSKWLFNWNTFIGDTRSLLAPNDRFRFFSDVFFVYNMKGKFSATGCAYLGYQERIDNVQKTDKITWWTANLIGRYNFNSDWSLSSRVEYFHDPNSAQISNITSANGFKTASFSLCINHHITDHILVRLEGRHFQSMNNAFIQNKKSPTNHNQWVTSSIAVWF